MWEAVVIFLNSLIKDLGIALVFLLSVLPPSPFKILSNSPISKYLGAINFFVPVTEILAIMQLWLTAIGIYYIWQIVLRWVKAIE